jgi:hypothetical protein
MLSGFFDIAEVLNINYSYLKGLFDSLLKNSYLVFQNKKLKNLIDNLILQKWFQKLFSVSQFLKLKN